MKRILNAEQAAKAWELAAEICGRFDCDGLTPHRTGAELEDLDTIVDEMLQQAKRLMAESVLIDDDDDELTSDGAVRTRRYYV